MCASHNSLDLTVYPVVPGHDTAWYPSGRLDKDGTCQTGGRKFPKHQTLKRPNQRLDILPVRERISSVRVALTSGLFQLMRRVQTPRASQT